MNISQRNSPPGRAWVPLRKNIDSPYGSIQLVISKHRGIGVCGTIEVDGSIFYLGLYFSRDLNNPKKLHIRGYEHQRIENFSGRIPVVLSDCRKRQLIQELKNVVQEYLESDYEILKQERYNELEKEVERLRYRIECMKKYQEAW